MTEGGISVASKIVLKCWLDDKLDINDIETRVPINFIGDTDRKYEFSFLSRTKSIALSYCHERVNLSDEKIETLEANGQQRLFRGAERQQSVKKEAERQEEIKRREEDFKRNIGDMIDGI